MEKHTAEGSERLLRTLLTGDGFDRKVAAETAGRLAEASQDIVDALLHVAQTDEHEYVRAAASDAFLKLTGSPHLLNRQVPASRVREISAAAGAPAPAPSGVSMSSPVAVPAEQPARYPALRGVASLFSVLALCALGLGAIGVIAGLVLLGDSTIEGVAILIASVVVGAMNYAICRAIAEAIGVLIDMESNTRQAAADTRRMAELLERGPGHS